MPAATAPVTPPDAAPATERPLTAEEIAAFHRDGYVIVKQFLSREEIEPLRQACLADPTIGGKLRAVADSDGNPQEVIGWTEPGPTWLGRVPFIARMIENSAALLGAPVYHWHSKLSMKAPNTKGRWDWHQDYPYWYNEGALWPDMLTVTVAVDPVDENNGCMKLVRRSHLLGRVDHKAVGESVAFDPERLELVLQQCETVPMVMEPGDACFFHGNTLHASGPNPSNRPRTLLHCSYNTIVNSPFINEGQEHHLYKPFETLADAAIRDGYSAVLDGHGWNPPKAAGHKNTYGYKVITRP
ncbi:phytanoyl-CoA dioxygenase family protein [Zavarzinia sp. CC-PAN008]|uniref:phytanoyl-CoA dioxygenase family protein n=1 Tax=Zavarzinia sp. CC-PAN008 TaxID=3243332 RepID=UPI003F744955